MKRTNVLDVLITVKSVGGLAASDDKIEIISSGSMDVEGDLVTLTYQESADEDTVFTTTLTVDGNDRAQLTRSGPFAGTRMTIEKGRRHLCHYQTPYGSMMIGVFGEKIRSRISENDGGQIDLCYTLDVNSEFHGRNEVSISVKPRPGAVLS